ncbi:MAG: hypothetical protein A3C81_00115 [Candidatus Yanofskybacteria bacterium RIFCSPHIGHO2_02_FULL_46_19]|uniref:Uncharacterized protein n=1 Tax=Candidatus Yanofskybacteria bacterium RIFCSPHIGHO2_02_FULL_46_19 TaxID=1802684 RepID=A0A1F8FTM1_9BACT|nr:MAG: hypothetical protein A3C81_00115 [Candidatus Yanofskybacteria bacterium RIFCSPHIGHO2_02_FULL_46_19]
MTINLDYFQKLLEDEKKRLEGELGTIGRRNPNAHEDWEVAKPDMNVMASAQDEIADVDEEFENRASVEAGLEERLRDVDGALERIRHGSYGVCPTGNHPIKEARLRANHAAKTCMEHAQSL